MLFYVFFAFLLYSTPFFHDFNVFLDDELLSVPLLDEGYFTGQGDYQFEIYRKMRTETGGDWSSHFPRTNIFWIHYLVDKILEEVKYSDKPGKANSAKVLGERTASAQNKTTPTDGKKEAQAARRKEKKNLRGFMDRVLDYKSVGDLVRDEVFADLVSDESVVSMLAMMSL